MKHFSAYFNILDDAGKAYVLMKFRLTKLL